MKTPQQIADTIAKHLHNQTQQCSNDWCGCLYRCPENPLVENVENVENKTNSCAVGCLIDDQFYSPSLEKKWCTELPVLDALEKSGCPKYFASTFCRSAQKIHDSNWNNRNEAFKDLCQSWDLQYNP